MPTSFVVAGVADAMVLPSRSMIQDDAHCPGIVDRPPEQMVERRQFRHGLQAVAADRARQCRQFAGDGIAVTGVDDRRVAPDDGRDTAAPPRGFGAKPSAMPLRLACRVWPARADGH